MSAPAARGKFAFLFLAAAVASLALGTAIWFLPSQYEAFALLKVASKPPTVLGRSATSEQDREEFAVFKRTQAQMLLSNVVIQGALRDATISRLSTIRDHSDDAVSWLKEQLVVDFPDNAEIMRVGMKGSNKDDLLKIVNKVVSVYMQEIVAREKELRLAQENKLQQTYASMQADLQKQLDSLHMLEALHKTSGSETAKLAKEMAVEELQGSMRQRAKILDEIRQTELEIELEKVRAESVPEVRTADDGAPPAGQSAPAASGIKVLEKKKDILQNQLAETNDALEKQMNRIETLQNFSAQVASKQEDIQALQRVNADLRSELDRIKVEKLAQERIIKIDEATIVSGQGYSSRRAAATAGLSLLGMCLFGVSLGLLAARR